MNLTVPIDAAGKLADPWIKDDLARLLDTSVGITDLWIFSHGWWTTGQSALSWYNRYVTNVSAKLPDRIHHLGVGIHWPSCVSENQGGAANLLLEPFTFFAMERRADVVGLGGVYELLRFAYDRGVPRIHLAGHSFGCKVVCSAAQRLARETFDAWGNRKTKIDAVLLQPAFENDALQRGGPYGESLHVIDEMLVSKSDVDTALKCAFPVAAAIGNLFTTKSRLALGYAGPTVQTSLQWGDKLKVWDVTLIQKNNPGYDGPGGHHDDVFCMSDDVVKFCTA